MSIFSVCMNVCVCDFGSWQAGRQVAAEVIPNSPLNGLLNSGASPQRAAQHKLNGIQCMRLTGPSATRAETLPWNSSHCIRTSVLLSHLYYLCVSEFVCEGSSGCLANAIFCRNPTRRGAEVLLFQILLQLRSSTPVLVSFQMFH